MPERSEVRLLSPTTYTHGDWDVSRLWFSRVDGWKIALQNQAPAHDYGADVRIVQPVPIRVGACAG